MCTRTFAYVVLAALLAIHSAARAEEATPLDDHRLHLEYHGVGYVVDRGFSFTNYIRMHPSGFRADQYQLYVAPTLGLGDGWEVTAGVTGTERRGRGGNALFPGLGFQKQLVREGRTLPALSVGVYGMTGHEHDAGSVYLAATKRLWSRGEQALYLHGGAKFEAYDSDDYGNSTGVRPYVGATYAFGKRFSLAAEFSPKQPWENTQVYALRANVRIYKRFGVSGGIRNNGFDTHPFVGISF